jgi:hypothetical protein
MSSDTINSIVLSTIRGCYCSYALAERCAHKISTKCNYDYNITYDCLLKYVRGRYCSYALADIVVNKIVSKNERSATTHISVVDLSIEKLNAIRRILES